MTTYQLGETVRVTATITDSDGNAADPLTVKVSIETPAGSLAVDATTMTKAATGSYYYDYTIPAATAGIPGKYNYKVTATGTSSRVTIVKSNFRAEASI